MAKEKTSAETLTELGIDPSNPDQAVEKLRSMRGSAGADETKIAIAAGCLNNPAAAQFLAEMESHASGALRREVRRALFRLRQHGVEPPRTQSQGAGARLAAAPTESVSSIISPVDPEGARLVWLFKARAQGGLSRLQGLTSEKEGLVGAHLAHLSRRELREERQEIERRSSIKLIEADYRLADFILCDAYRHTPEQRLGHVGNFLALRAEILAAAPPADYRHPIYDELADSLTQEPSPELLNEPELAGWVIPESELKPYLNEVEEIRQSPLVLNQYQQEERINAVIARALDELVGGERGRPMRRRLEDTAYYLARTGRTHQARWAAAAAVRLRNGEQLTRIPFFVQYLRRSMGMVLSEQQAQTQQQPRLIMTPAEAMRAQAAARARRQPRR